MTTFTKIRKELPALKVKQWLNDWDNVKWSRRERRAEPRQWFYQFTIPAAELKALSGIYPRSLKERQRGVDDLGIQRRHEEGRSEEIAEFVRFGYPWSDLSKAKRASTEFNDLRKPGWLPTAIVVNILLPTDDRNGKKVDKADLVTVRDESNEVAAVSLPKGFSKNWKPNSIPPIEVIDGQHRLWAFSDKDIPSGNFELPVVAFVGLDLSWQAYLFYTINIKPKKINASLAFDLYPLLRTEDWLTKFEGHIVYRETRAQELVDLIWSHPKSPWYKRINMLGESGHKGIMVSQSAWVRSLLATYIKSWEGRGVRVGGLFGAPVGSHELTLPWSRPDQAAFLIVVGQIFSESIRTHHGQWAKALRAQGSTNSKEDEDLAFYGSKSLLNQDQGIRALLHITNDLMFVRADALRLGEWGKAQNVDGDDEARVNHSIQSLKKQNKVIDYMKSLCDTLAEYDWRASDAPGLSNDQRLLKAAFRGSGGYKELRRHILQHIEREGGEIGNAAKKVIEALGY